MLKVSGSMSAKTGSAPTRRTALAEAANENDGTMTSSPAAMPSAIKARCRAEVPELTATQCRPADELGELGLEGGHLRALHDLAAVQDADGGVDVGLVDHRSGQGHVRGGWQRHSWVSP